MGVTDGRVTGGARGSSTSHGLLLKKDLHGMGFDHDSQQSHHQESSDSEHKRGEQGPVGTLNGHRWEALENQCECEGSEALATPTIVSG